MIKVFEFEFEILAVVVLVVLISGLARSRCKVLTEPKLQSL